MNKFKTSGVWVLSLALFGLLGPLNVWAAYPDKTVSVIVPFGPGGGFDILARAIAIRLEKELGTPFVIKNVPGSGGKRGSVTLFKSKPDGYTIGLPHFVPFQTDELILGRKIAIDYKKFESILKIATGKHFIFVNKKTPYNSLADLKNSTGPIKFTATGIGIIWIEVNALAAEVGFKAKFVTGYRSLPQAVLAVARGDAQGSAGSYHHFEPLLGDLRPLVFLGPKRDPRLPDVPSISELGYPGLAVLGSPYSVAAPPGTPEDRLRVIRQALLKVVRRPDFTQWAEKQGLYVDIEEPAALWKTLGENAQIYRDLRPLLRRSKDR